jgi:hypothetical protein
MKNESRTTQSVIIKRGGGRRLEGRRGECIVRHKLNILVSPLMVREGIACEKKQEIGVQSPSGVFTVAPRSTRDWGGRRVIHWLTVHPITKTTVRGITTNPYRIVSILSGRTHIFHIIYFCRSLPHHAPASPSSQIVFNRTISLSIIDCTALSTYPPK